MIQGGDPTGSGDGGESAFGRPFKDEFHQRLRFSHRGLVAMANDGPDRNRSQFFITLDRTEDLNNLHTIFGKVGDERCISYRSSQLTLLQVVGNTIYNVLKMGELETDDKERPIYPPKIISASVLSNPFEDVFARPHILEQRQRRIREQNETAAEKRLREMKKQKGVK